MTDRIIQIHCGAKDKDALRDVVDSHDVIASWYNNVNDDRVHFHILLETFQTQKMLDDIQEKMNGEDDFHLLILPVEAYMPRPKEAEDEDEAKKKEREKAKASIVREELENDMVGNASFDRNYILLVIFSTLVASIGMLENNIAVLIGAMVIAPFLAPNLALTFASTMGNTTLAYRAARTLLFGSVIAFVCGAGAGQFWPIEDLPPELKLRSKVDYSSIILALAAGASAVLSLTKGISSILVGVMVAAALLPPLAAAGVFLGHGHYQDAGNAMVLLAVNIVCINLSGLLTFILRGVGPRTWYEKREAKKSVYIYAASWGTALLFLIAAIYGLNIVE